MNTLHHRPHLDIPPFLNWPRTRAGMFSAWLGLIGLVLVIANVFTATDGSQAGLLQLEVMLMLIVAPASLIAAVMAAFRDHERSIFVWIPIAVGSLFLAFMFIELTFPHE